MPRIKYHCNKCGEPFDHRPEVVAHESECKGYKRLTQIDMDFLFDVANKANAIIKLIWARQKKGASPNLVPDVPPRLCLVEIESVIVALYKVLEGNQRQGRQKGKE